MTPFGQEGLKCYAPWDTQRIDDIVTLGIGEMGHYILMYEDELPTLHNIFCITKTKRRPTAKIFRPSEEGIRLPPLSRDDDTDDGVSNTPDQKSEIQRHIRTAYHMFNGQGDADKTLTQKIHDNLQTNHQEELQLRTMTPSTIQNIIEQCWYLILSTN